MTKKLKPININTYCIYERISVQSIIDTAKQVLKQEDIDLNKLTLEIDIEDYSYNNYGSNRPELICVYNAEN